MANIENPTFCDAASCVAGVAVGLAIGLVGFASCTSPFAGAGKAL